MDSNNGNIKVDTGIGKLDHFISDGLRKGELMTIIIGAPKPSRRLIPVVGSMFVTSEISEKEINEKIEKIKDGLTKGTKI